MVYNEFIRLSKEHIDLRYRSFCITFKRLPHVLNNILHMCVRTFKGFLYF